MGVLSEPVRKAICFVFFTAQAYATCYVVSGLKYDKKGVFAGVQIPDNCQVVYSFAELETLAPVGQILDVRLLAHGAENKDGSIVVGGSCQLNESPAAVIGILNKLSKDNKVFASFASCYSDQIQKERMIFDRTHPTSDNFMIDRSCIYSASTAKNAAYPSEKSLYSLQFNGVRNKRVVDMFTESHTGLLSASPFDSAGITDAWINEKEKKEPAEQKEAFALYAATLAKLSMDSSNRSCNLLSASVKLNPEQYDHLSLDLKHLTSSDINVSKLQKFADFIDREAANPAHSKELAGVGQDGEKFYSLIRNIRNRFEETDPANPSYVGVANEISNSTYTNALESYFRIRGLLNGLEATPAQIHKYKFFPNELNPQKLETDILALLKGCPSQFQSGTLEKLIGADGTNEPDGIHAASWDAALGQFSRLTVQAINQGKYKVDKEIDQRRFKACERFYYNEAGSLQFSEDGAAEPSQGHA